MASSCGFATAGSVDDGKSHADRSAALRLQGDLRGPARGGRAHQRATAATSTPTWRCSPTACGPSASRASPSTSPTATSPRPSGSSSSPTPPATSSTRATWSPAPRPPTSRSSWSTPARASSSSRRRHAFLAVAAADPAPRAVRQQDGPRRLRPRSASRRSRPSSAQFATKLDVTDLTFIPISALHGDNVVHRSDEHALVRGHVAAAPPRGGAHRVRPQPHRRPLPGAVRHPPADRRATTTTAATPARSPAACSSRATRSSCCRRASPPRIAAIDTPDGPVDEAFAPMSVTVTPRPTTSTSRRGDMICRPAQPARTSARTSTPWSAG